LAAINALLKELGIGIPNGGVVLTAGFGSVQLPLLFGRIAYDCHGSPTEPKGWIGERTDPETGLTYLHARYYDAALGRFLSPDWSS
jgi:hypothetical protein